MKLSTLTKRMFFLTALSLVYIHMQMQIFDLAYQGKQNERIIRELNENNGNVTYNILKLKSSNNIGYKMLADDSGLCFMDKESIVKLNTNDEGLENDKVALLPKVKKANVFLSFFSLKSEAHARPQE